MTQIDQFESIFRAASINPFVYQDWDVKRVLTICDGNQEEAVKIQDQVQAFFSHALEVESIDWRVLIGSEFQNVSRLIESVQESKPDLICCRRNLHVAADEYPFSLGVYVEVLTQMTDIPVLLLPTENEQSRFDPSQESKRVIAITDHLDDDAMLINSAIKMTANGGTLYLAHVEDERSFLRIMEVVEKIAEIDSDTAREKIRERLLLDPQKFVESCQAEIANNQLDIEVKPIVKMGHSLSDYSDLVQSNQVDLVVIHTKDEDQLAMHGLAYPLTVELHETPMLLI